MADNAQALLTRHATRPSTRFNTLLESPKFRKFEKLMKWTLGIVCLLTSFMVGFLCVDGTMISDYTGSTGKWEYNKDSLFFGVVTSVFWFLASLLSFVSSGADSAPEWATAEWVIDKFPSATENELDIKKPTHWWANFVRTYVRIGCVFAIPSVASVITYFIWYSKHDEPKFNYKYDQSDKMHNWVPYVDAVGIVSTMVSLTAVVFPCIQRAFTMSLNMVNLYLKEMDSGNPTILDSETHWEILSSGPHWDRLANLYFDMDETLEKMWKMQGEGCGATYVLLLFILAVGAVIGLGQLVSSYIDYRVNDLAFESFRTNFLSGLAFFMFGVGLILCLLILAAWITSRCQSGDSKDCRSHIPIKARRLRRNIDFAADGNVRDAYMAYLVFIEGDARIGVSICGTLITYELVASSAIFAFAKVPVVFSLLLGCLIKMMSNESGETASWQDACMHAVHILENKTALV